MTVRVLVASNNAKKLKELQQVLDDCGIDGVELVALGEVCLLYTSPSPRDS